MQTPTSDQTWNDSAGPARGGWGPILGGATRVVLYINEGVRTEFASRMDHKEVLTKIPEGGAIVTAPPLKSAAELLNQLLFEQES